MQRNADEGFAQRCGIVAPKDSLGGCSIHGFRMTVAKRLVHGCSFLLPNDQGISRGARLRRRLHARGRHPMEAGYIAGLRPC